uniref:Rab-GAP TBC domain-containing protein n=1 Tax=Ananas comosus var. bracteatus TaxID=296719 RepID=A0A6V7PMH5_ANACO|nr:unnamed protein product [Ananas comosus var. bracteatus]
MAISSSGERFPRQRFGSLRGVRWRVDLGILPSSAASIEEIRRVAADSRRRYASLRRQLLIDPHLLKDESKPPDPIVENPLSQNPDSMWGRFFQNAELEKTLNQDLSRLYPEEGSYFQTAACQSMLGRILLVWCLKHPEYGYRQGMHELLAPLLYVLHVDVQHSSQARGLEEDRLIGDYNSSAFPERDIISDYKSEEPTNIRTNKNGSSRQNASEISSLDELDPDTRELFLMNDAYGAEGELGIVVSEKFLEHDTYCMFDGLMNGASGIIAIADFFSVSLPKESNTGLAPVLEASEAIYHLLSSIDLSLYSHLTELGVEPQYFSLRWLRVLFGREFSLENLLAVWDEIFFYPNSTFNTDKENRGDYKVLSSPRGAFIISMAISMLLHLRSSLLASEHATTCLQRLVNFPEDINVRKLIGKAKSLQSLALDINFSSCQQRTFRNYVKGDGMIALDHPKTSSDYWEEKWKVIYDTEVLSKITRGGSIISKTRKGLFNKRLLSPQAESDADKTVASKKKDHWSTLRRIILDGTNHADENSDMPKASGFTPSGSEEGINCADEEEINHDVVSCRRSDASPFIANYIDEFRHVEELGSSSIDAETRKAFNKEKDFKPQNSSGNEVISQDILSILASCERCHSCGVSLNPEAGDGEVMNTFRCLGHSILANIQVIESFFEQDLGLDLVDNLTNAASNRGKEQEAIAALKELRKIANLFSGS